MNETQTKLLVWIASALMALNTTYEGTEDEFLTISDHQAFHKLMKEV